MGHFVVSPRVGRLQIVEHLHSALTSRNSSSARDERAGSGFTTSWPVRSRHFRALLNNAVQHIVWRCKTHIT
jgi:hypothetical protein